MNGHRVELDGHVDVQMLRAFYMQDAVIWLSDILRFFLVWMDKTVEWRFCFIIVMLFSL